MTIQQLQYVLEIARCGSVSKAAKHLFLSQPNLSSSIKNLESELGITIFERTPSGMRLTQAGNKLVQKASLIMTQLNDISEDANTENRSHLFRVVYPLYYPAFEAFVDLCRDYQDGSVIHLSCYTGTGPKQLEALHQNLCDLVVFIDTHSHFPDFYRYCSSFNLEYVELAQMLFSVQLSDTHPLLQKEPFDFERLKDYPYVAFSDLYSKDVNWAPWSSFVNPDKLICVQSTMSRLSVVAETNAFSIVLPHAAEFNETHNVTTIPLPFNPLKLGYIYSKERGLGECGNAYVRHLRKRLSFHLEEGEKEA